VRTIIVPTGASQDTRQAVTCEMNFARASVFLRTVFSSFLLKVDYVVIRR
jgi:hypothetical protein